MPADLHSTRPAPRAGQTSATAEVQRCVAAAQPWLMAWHGALRRDDAALQAARRIGHRQTQAFAH